MALLAGYGTSTLIVCEETGFSYTRYPPKISIYLEWTKIQRKYKAFHQLSRDSIHRADTCMSPPHGKQRMSFPLVTDAVVFPCSFVRKRYICPSQHMLFVWVQVPIWACSSHAMLRRWFGKQRSL